MLKIGVLVETPAGNGTLVGRHAGRVYVDLEAGGTWRGQDHELIPLDNGDYIRELKEVVNEIHTEVTSLCNWLARLLDHDNLSGINRNMIKEAMKRANETWEDVQQFNMEIQGNLNPEREEGQGNS